MYKSNYIWVEKRYPSINYWLNFSFLSVFRCSKALFCKQMEKLIRGCVINTYTQPHLGRLLR